MVDRNEASNPDNDSDPPTKDPDGDGMKPVRDRAWMEFHHRYSRKKPPSEIRKKPPEGNTK